MMKSMVTYDSNTNTSLLQLLWRYKEQLDYNYVLNVMADLAGIIATDSFIQEFFSELPSLTYQYARYTDWFRPYLEKQLKNYSTSSSLSNVQSLVDKVSTLLGIYESFLLHKDG